MSAAEPGHPGGVHVALLRLKRAARANTRTFVALVLGAVVMSAVLVAALAGFGTAAGSASGHAAGAASPLATHAAPTVADSNVSGPNIFNDIWNLFAGFFSIILSGLGNAFNTVFGAFANGVATMFQGWGFSLGSYGVWGPLMLVVSLGVAAIVAYVMLDMVGIEKDFDEGEAEV